MDRPMVEVPRAVSTLRRWWWIPALAAVLGALLGLSSGGGGDTSITATVEVAPAPGVSLLTNLQRGGQLFDQLPLAVVVDDLTATKTKTELGAAVAGSDVAATLAVSKDGTGDQRRVTITTANASAARARQALDAYVDRFRTTLRTEIAARADDAEKILDAVPAGDTTIALRRSLVEQLRATDPLREVKVEEASSTGPAKALPALLALALATLAAGALVLLSPFDPRLHTVTDVERVAGEGSVTLTLARGDPRDELTLALGALAAGGEPVQLVPVGEADVATLATEAGSEAAVAVPALTPTTVDPSGRAVLVVQLGADRADALDTAVRIARLGSRRIDGIVALNP